MFERCVLKEIRINHKSKDLNILSLDHMDEHNPKISTDVFQYRLGGDIYKRVDKIIEYLYPYNDYPNKIGFLDEKQFLKILINKQSFRKFIIYRSRKNV